MKLSITIMAHPRRKEFIPYLLDILGKDTPIAWDEKNNLWDTCRRAWLATDFTSDWTLVIQDDAILTSNFKEKVEKFLENGDNLYCFYGGDILGERIEKAKAKGENLVFTDMILNEVAICIKTEYVKEMVKFCDDRDADNDHLISVWARRKGLKIANSIPSLVNHRDTESIFRENYNFKPAEKARKAYFYEE